MQIPRNLASELGAGLILDSFKITGKNALVTGSNKGLGATIALALAEAGANVAIHGRSSDHGDISGRIRKLGRNSFFYPVDLTSSGACERLFDSVIRTFHNLDILVNNAGCIRRSPAAEFPSEFWDEVIQVNLGVVWRLSQLAGRHMLDQGHGGKIVNIASVLSFQGGVFVPSYATAKGGVAQLTKALANEWAAKGINVNAIAPGYMETDNTKALREDPNRSRQILDRIPSGRWGKPSDLAGTAVFLCSPAADYIHGHILVVDGGWLGR